MKAKVYLSEVKTEYANIRKLRAKVDKADREEIRGILREDLRRAGEYYAAVLNEVWDVIEQVELEEETEREILLRRYIFLETLESIGTDMGFSRRSVYNRHSKAVSRVQKLLDSRKKTGDAVCA